MNCGYIVSEIISHCQFDTTDMRQEELMGQKSDGRARNRFNLSGGGPRHATVQEPPLCPLEV